MMWWGYLSYLIDLTLPDSDTKVHLKISHIENFGVNVHSAVDRSHTIRPGDYRLVQRLESCLCPDQESE